MEETMTKRCAVCDEEYDEAYDACPACAKRAVTAKADEGMHSQRKGSDLKGAGVLMLVLGAAAIVWDFTAGGAPDNGTTGILVLILGFLLAVLGIAMVAVGAAKKR
jgi:predicted phage tail protein